MFLLKLKLFSLIFGSCWVVWKINYVKSPDLVSIGWRKLAKLTSPWPPRVANITKRFQTMTTVIRISHTFPPTKMHYNLWGRILLNMRRHSTSPIDARMWTPSAPRWSPTFSLVCLGLRGCFHATFTLVSLNLFVLSVEKADGQTRSEGRQAFNGIHWGPAVKATQPAFQPSPQP